MCRLSNFVKNDSTTNPLSIKKLNEKQKQCMRKKAQKKWFWLDSITIPAIPEGCKMLTCQTRYRLRQRALHRLHV